MKPLFVIRLSSHFFVFSSLLGISSSGWTQDTTISTLDEVKVTATRQSGREAAQLSSVDVYERADIEASGQTTLAGLLSHLPGLDVSSNGVSGTASVSIRGAESRHTLLLIDGVRVSALSVGLAPIESIPLAGVDRIEILRGPASALYGSDAIGGVIQVFTRKGETGIHPEIFVGMGTRGSEQTQASLRGGEGALSYAVSVGQDASHGVNAIADARKQPYYYQPDRDGGRNQYANAAIRYAPSAQDAIGLNLFHTLSHNDYDAFLSDYDAYSRHEVNTIAAHWEHRFHSDWKSTLRIAQSDDHNESHDAADTASRFNSSQKQFMWQNDIRLPLGQLLAAYEYNDQSLHANTTTYTRDDRQTQAALLGWSGNFDAHSLQTNIRYDHYSDFGGKTSGLLAYGYQLTPQWRLLASVANAFNAPTFNQLYWPDNGYGGGNPHLKPERALNEELGVRWHQDTHVVQLSYFHNRIKDMIAGWPPENIRRATLKGLSLAYSGELPLGFTWESGLDWLSAKDQDTGKSLPRRADQAGFVRISRTQGKWHYGLDWNGRGRRFEDGANTQRMGGYGLLDTYLHYTFEKDWRLELRVDNLLDKRYETAWGYGTLGTMVYAGVRWSPK